VNEFTITGYMITGPELASEVASEAEHRNLEGDFASSNAAADRDRFDQRGRPCRSHFFRPFIDTRP